MRIGTVSIETHDGQHFFRVEVIAGDLDPDELKVELYADAGQKGGSAVELMAVCKGCANSKGSYNLFCSRYRQLVPLRITPLALFPSTRTLLCHLKPRKFCGNADARCE